MNCMHIPEGRELAAISTIRTLRFFRVFKLIRRLVYCIHKLLRWACVLKERFLDEKGSAICTYRLNQATDTYDLDNLGHQLHVKHHLNPNPNNPCQMVIYACTTSHDWHGNDGCCKLRYGTNANCIKLLIRL